MEMACITGLFHCMVRWSIRSPTFIEVSTSGLKSGGWGNHLRELTILLCPLPIFHLDLSWIMSLADNKLCHTKEGLWPSSASMNEHLGKYQALYTRKKREWVPVTNLQACLASIAWLNSWMSLTPISPLSFGVHNMFQFIQWIFFSLRVCPHQYLATVELIPSHTFLGILKMLIVYVGITWTTILIKTSLPAFEIVFSFHPITLFVILSSSSLKVLTFDFPPTMGSPRYFSQLCMTCAPIKFWISSLSLQLLFGLKNNVVFCLLMAYPHASSYCVSMSSRWQHLLFLASQNSKLSSAKRRWEIQTPPRQEYIPFSLFVFAAFLIKEDSPLAQKRKR